MSGLDALRPSRRDLLFASAALAISAAAPARAGVLDGRRIRFLIGNEGTGGYETYARLIAKHLALALPATTVTVEMVPTADGRLAAKQIFEATGDPLTIGLFESALLYSELTEEQDPGYELGKFKWLGKLTVDVRVLIASTRSGIRSLEDLRARTEPAIYPGTSVASRAAFECLILDTLLGLSIKPVPGYDAAQRALAIIGGEGQVVLGSYSSLQNLVEDGDASVILRLNDVAIPEPSMSAPLLADVAPKPLSKLVDLIRDVNDLGRWIAAPPAIAPDDLAALRAAFDTAVASEALLAEARAGDRPIDPLGGEEVQRRIEALVARKDALKAELKSAIACGERRAEGYRGAC